MGRLRAFPTFLVQVYDTCLFEYDLTEPNYQVLVTTMTGLWACCESFTVCSICVRVYIVVQGRAGMQMIYG